MLNSSPTQGTTSEPRQQVPTSSSLMGSIPEDRFRQVEERREILEWPKASRGSACNTGEQLPMNFNSAAESVDEA